VTLADRQKLILAFEISFRTYNKKLMKVRGTFNVQQDN